MSDTSPFHAAGTETLRSGYSFSETVARITGALQSHGIKIFATIDQQAEAREAGLTMPAMTLVLFGNPKAGTALMVAQPSSGLDLPLKVLVWEAGSGDVFVSFNTADYIIGRHGLGAELKGNIAPAERLIAGALV